MSDIRIVREDLDTITSYMWNLREALDKAGNGTEFAKALMDDDKDYAKSLKPYFAGLAKKVKEIRVWLDSETFKPMDNLPDQFY
jgi:hypothetical protein